MDSQITQIQFGAELTSQIAYLEPECINTKIIINLPSEQQKPCQNSEFPNYDLLAIDK